MTHFRNPSHASYIKSDVWRCPKSPSGAHHWVEKRTLSTDYGTFECIYCGEKKIPGSLA